MPEKIVYDSTQDKTLKPKKRKDPRVKVDEPYSSINTAFCTSTKNWRNT